MLHLLFKVKKCLDVCESNKQQTSNEQMAFLPYIFVLFCSPAVSTTTPNSMGERGGYNISCRDIRHFQLRISANTLPHCNYILVLKILGLA
jgi:hypothetical protein